MSSYVSGSIPPIYSSFWYRTLGCDGVHSTLGKTELSRRVEPFRSCLYHSRSRNSGDSILNHVLFSSFSCSKSLVINSVKQNIPNVCTIPKIWFPKLERNQCAVLSFAIHSTLSLPYPSSSLKKNLRNDYFKAELFSKSTCWYKLPHRKWLNRRWVNHGYLLLPNLHIAMEYRVIH